MGQIAVHDFDNNHSRYFLQIWQYEPLSASISNHRKSATYLKSPLGFCFLSHYTSFSARDLRQLTSGVISVSMTERPHITQMSFLIYFFFGVSFGVHRVRSKCNVLV